MYRDSRCSISFVRAQNATEVVRQLEYNFLFKSARKVVIAIPEGINTSQESDAHFPWLYFAKKVEGIHSSGRLSVSTYSPHFMY